MGLHSIHFKEVKELSKEILIFHFGQGPRSCGCSNFVNFELLDFFEYSPVHHYIRDLKAGMPQHHFFGVFLTANFEGPQFCTPLAKIDLLYLFGKT